MNAIVAATVILLYSIVCSVGAVEGALRSGEFSIFTIPVSALFFVGPAIGIYRRANWCRIFLGIWFTLVLGYFLSLPFTAGFTFYVWYLALLLASALPVFLLFFYPPLKLHTQNVQRPEQNA